MFLGSPEILEKFVESPTVFLTSLDIFVELLGLSIFFSFARKRRRISGDQQENKTSVKTLGNHLEPFKPEAPIFIS